MTLESILDTDKNIADKLDKEILELKSKIRSWMIDHVRVSTKSSYFYNINPRDFEVDDELLISVKNHIEELSIYGCLDIPTYIRFKYVGKEFKISECNVKSGDASFLLKNLSKEGKETLDEVFIKNTNFKTIGDWSKMKLWMFDIEYNKYLKMKVSELPNIDVSLTYLGNGNEFKLSDVKSKLKYPDMTVVRLDHATQNVKESIMDTDDSVVDKIKDKSYYIALLAKKLVETYKKTFDLKEIYMTKHYDYVYLCPDFPLLDKLRKILKPNVGDTGPERKFVQEIIEPLTAKLYIEGVIKKAKIDNIAHVTNDWFTAFKMGDISSFSTPGSKKYIFPAIGIRIFELHDPMMYIDLGEEKLNEELIKYIKQYR